MHEEWHAHWGKAKQVIEEAHAGRTLRTWRMPPDREHETMGFAECWIGSAIRTVEGVFTLRWHEGTKTIGGYLWKTLDDMYIFAPRPVETTADWQDLLAFVKRLLDLDYQFPADLHVEYRHTDLSEKIKDSKKKPPQS